MNRLLILDEGCIIEAGAVIFKDVKISKGTIVIVNAVVGNNTKVSACCQIKYNCPIQENATVPDMTKVDCNMVYNGQAKL